MNPRLISVIFTLLFFTSVHGTDHNFSFRQISINEGLSQSYVTAIFRDTRGYLWIGTQNGLNRFYKNDLKSYFHSAEDGNSIPDNTISDIVEDDDGRIWVATPAGLSCLDPVKDVFTVMSTFRVTASVATETGIFWVGDDFMLHYDYRAESLEYIKLDVGIINIQQIDPRTLMLATYDNNDGGFYSYDIEERSGSQVSGIDIPRITAFLITPAGEYFVASFDKGLFHLRADGSPIRHYTTADSELSNDIILDIIRKDSSIWLATDGGGINILDPDTGRMETVTHVEGNNNSLMVGSINRLYQDGEMVWAGSVRGGAICIRDSWVQNYRGTVFSSDDGLSDNAVISLHEDREGILWIGTDGGGINRFDPRTDRFTHYPLTRHEKVVAMADLSEDRLLVSAYKTRLSVFDKKRGTYTPFPVPAEVMSNGYLIGLLNVAPGKIYIVSENVFSYDTRTGRYDLVKDESNPAKGLNVGTVAMSGEHCFIANRSDIFAINTITDEMRFIGRIPQEEKINSMVCGRDSVLWIGSNAGLGRFDLKTDVYERVETRRLLGTVSKLIIDGNRLWICADNKFYSYLTDENRFIEWSEFDGFYRNDILTGLYNGTGKIHFGGTEGLVIIDRSIPFPDEPLPVPILNSIDLNGKPYIGHLKNSHIEIPYNYASFSIRVDVSEQDLFRTPFVRYDIQGKTHNTYESSNNVLDLPLLSPGTYDIYVSCNTKMGEWTDPTLLLTVEVTSPWYRTAFALSAFTLILLSLTALSVYAYIGRKQRRMKEKASEQLRILNENKIRFLINVSHELRTPLTLIYSPLKRLVRDSAIPGNDIRPALEGMYRQAKEMKNIIDMTLDIGKLDSGNGRLDLKEHEIDPWIRNVCEGFEGEYRDAGVELVYELSPRAGCAVFDRAKCNIILYNLLINALKFSPAGTTVTVSSHVADGHVEISVSDQGIGLANVDKDKLFTNFYQGAHDKKGTGIGLAYSKQLVELHRGSMEVAENPAGGAVFSFKIPLNIALRSEAAKLAAAKEVDIDECDGEHATQERPEYTFPGRSIIVVEDHSELASYMERLFAPLFDTVHIAHDGKEALEIITTAGPDIIISDVMMPVMDGLELCGAVKGNIALSHIPVILLTAKGDPDSLTAGLKNGADIYISKPFEEETVLAAIDNLLRIRERIRTVLQADALAVIPPNPSICTADELFLARFNEIVEENINNAALNVDFLTARLGMSRTSLYNRIKHITGMSAIDYIIRIRIDKACALLLNADSDIKEIAYALGFSNQRYFSTLFRKVKKMSPSAYRELHKTAMFRTT